MLSTSVNLSPNCALSMIDASVPLMCSVDPVEESGDVGGVKFEVYSADFLTLTSVI